MPTDHKTVAVGYLHPGEVSHSFHRSMRDLWMWDLGHRRRLRAFIEEECGASRLIDGRNSVVRQFLAHDIEWLAFVDADMGFAPDALDELLNSADQYRRPVVGGLCFASRKVRQVDANARLHEAIPTLYRWIDPEDGQPGFAPIYNYPRDQVVEVDGTGAAFFIVHRRVLEKVRDQLDFPSPREWFDDTNYRGRIFGEDLTFCRRVASVGEKIHVHTGVKTSHYKHTYLEEGILDAAGAGDVPTWAVIPFKDKAELTGSLVAQLRAQGSYRGLILCDNGSDEPETKQLLAALAGDDGIAVLDAAGQSIHQMWNAGLAYAEQRSPARFNVALLNNDLRIGDGFLQGLAAALRSDSTLGAVCPNYDGRSIDGPLEYTRDICANRYDGTGGLAGFAFMIRGESAYRFPESPAWWYGDNDLVMTIVASGARAAIVADVTVEHLDGGSRTGRWDGPEWAPLLEADRQAFHAKWRRPVAV